MAKKATKYSVCDPNEYPLCTNNGVNGCNMLVTKQALAAVAIQMDPSPPVSSSEPTSSPLKTKWAI
jgi:hypothetical protein